MQLSVGGQGKEMLPWNYRQECCGSGRLSVVWVGHMDVLSVLSLNNAAASSSSLLPSHVHICHTPPFFSTLLLSINCTLMSANLFPLPTSPLFSFLVQITLSYLSALLRCGDTGQWHTPKQIKRWPENVISKTRENCIEVFYIALKCLRTCFGNRK